MLALENLFLLDTTISALSCGAVSWRTVSENNCLLLYLCSQNAARTMCADVLHVSKISICLSEHVGRSADLSSETFYGFISTPLIQKHALWHICPCIKTDAAIYATYMNIYHTCRCQDYNIWNLYMYIYISTRWFLYGITSQGLEWKWIYLYIICLQY